MAPVDQSGHAMKRKHPQDDSSDADTQSPGKVAKRYDFKTLSLDQLNEVVTVTLDHERTNIKLFRYLTLKYAPDFAILFADPRITEITLKGVSLNKSKDLWEAHDEEPDWTLAGCVHDGLRTGDPLHPFDNLVWCKAKTVDVCVDAFIFANTYNIARLRQDALDRLCWCFNEKCRRASDAAVFIQDEEECIEPPSVQVMQHAYNNTTPGSPLRKLLVNAFCAFHHPSGSIMVTSIYPRKFLADVVDCFASGGTISYSVRGKKYRAINPCDYHAHGSEEQRRKCTKLRVYFHQDEKVWDMPGEKA